MLARLGDVILLPVDGGRASSGSRSNAESLMAACTEIASGQWLSLDMMVQGY